MITALNSIAPDENSPASQDAGSMLAGSKFPTLPLQHCSCAELLHSSGVLKGTEGEEVGRDTCASFLQLEVTLIESITYRIREQKLKTYLSPALLSKASFRLICRKIWQEMLSNASKELEDIDDKIGQVARLGEKHRTGNAGGEPEA